MPHPILCFKTVIPSQEVKVKKYIYFIGVILAIIQFILVKSLILFVYIGFCSKTRSMSCWLIILKPLLVSIRLADFDSKLFFEIIYENYVILQQTSKTSGKRKSPTHTLISITIEFWLPCDVSLPSMEKVSAVRH